MRCAVTGFLLAVCAGLVQPAPGGENISRHKADVVVFGATAAGVTAAVAAAREGKSVILVDPGRHVGGMVSGGLGATDAGNRGAVGGYAREFFDRIRDYYVKKYGPKSPQVKDCSGGFHFEPHVAEKIFKDMLRETRVKVFHQQRLILVSKIGPHIDLISTRNLADGARHEFQGLIFIDAGYEGDVLAGAKVSYTLGRESRAELGESIAGVQKFSPAHQWPVKISPRDPRKMLLPFIQSDPPGKAGDGDKKIQAYNFRLCMTRDKDQIVPFPRPANYDPARFELLARYLAQRPDLKVGQLMNPVRMPNGKTDTNNNGPFSTDHIGANWDYPEADWQTRAKIWKDHEDYVKGFLYFLANDPRVPPALHKEMISWGLARGEFTDHQHFPHQLYVREARRMKGVYFMTQTDIMDKRTKPDSVGLGSYNTDSHHVQRVVGPDGFVLNEGDFQVRVSPYAIPYRSLIPRAGECDNLLVPVCLSASHVAYGTIRMEPVYMIMGQACGVAAALAIDAKTGVQMVSIDKLQEKLKEQKAILSPKDLPAPAKKGLDPAKWPGIVVDDPAAVQTGPWVFSTSVGPYVGEGYLHDNNQDQGKRRIRFTPRLPKSGRYEVRLFFPPFANRASNALVVIHFAGGEKTMRLNQRKTLPNGGSLGTYPFDAGKAGFVEIRNDGADGFVVADAVQWLMRP